VRRHLRADVNPILAKAPPSRSNFLPAIADNFFVKDKPQIALRCLYDTGPLRYQQCYDAPAETFTYWP